MRRLFGGKLAQIGLEVMYSDNGNEGRELARRFQPDLILLDIRLPGTDGFEIASRLHNERQTAHIPIVFLTNEDLSMEAEKNSKELWVQGYIHKSIDLNEFAKRVQGFLEAPTKSPPEA
jgi:DNA-binding response OmpR family regulator